MSATVETRAVGAPHARLEAGVKVTGQARYAVERDEDGLLYAAIVQSTVAKGRIERVDPAAALATPGVVDVIWHANAARLHTSDRPFHVDADMLVLQGPEVAYRGQIVACVVAETFEVAQDAVGLVEVAYAQEPHDVVLTTDHPTLREPEPGWHGPEKSELGDVERALSEATVVIDETYVTPAIHHQPMEPHAAFASWRDGRLTLYDATQGASFERDALATLFDVDAADVHVIAEHVGGGFGGRAGPSPHAVVAALASKHTGAPVKLAVTRQQMFAFLGYRSPTIQRVRLGATADGKLAAIAHESVEQTSTVKVYSEDVTRCSQVMYAAAHRRTGHRIAALDVPTPTWLRGPACGPGMFALESAIDELAVACGIDPIELRVRNEPDEHPQSGAPFASRHFVDCLREGAERFGWPSRRSPRSRRDGRRLIGTGVAASTFPAQIFESQAVVRCEPDGSYTVRISATDIGTGARTALAQIAADALDAPLGRVRVEIGDSALPAAFPAAGSAGTVSWATAILGAVRGLREQLAELGEVPAGGIEVFYDSADEVAAMSHDVERHAFGAQFAEVRVDEDTGEVRVARLLGVFDLGRIINPTTARSQLVGGMIMGLSIALQEESVVDLEHGDYLNHDLAQYHIATCADAVGIEATWIVDEDGAGAPFGGKGVGEIGTVGTAAAIANAVYDATGVRVRDLPIRLDKLLG